MMCALRGLAQGSITTVPHIYLHIPRFFLAISSRTSARLYAGLYILMRSIEISIYLSIYYISITIKTYVLHKNPDGPFHGSC